MEKYINRLTRFVTAKHKELKKADVANNESMGLNVSHPADLIGDITAEQHVEWEARSREGYTIVDEHGDVIFSPAEPDSELEESEPSNPEPKPKDEQTF